MFVAMPLDCASPTSQPKSAVQQLNEMAAMSMEMVRAAGLGSPSTSESSQASKHGGKFEDLLSSPISVLEAFKSFREDLDVLSLDSVSEEVLADPDFLFDLSEDDMSDIGPIPSCEPLAQRLHVPAEPVKHSLAGINTAGAAPFQLPSPPMASVQSPTPRSPFEDALDSGRRSFSGFSGCSGSGSVGPGPLLDLEAIAAARSSSGSLLRPAESVGSPIATAAAAPTASAAAPQRFCGLADEAVSSMRLEDFVSSASAASAVSHINAARARAAAAVTASAAVSPQPSAAVARLERAASSLADNLQTCLARLSSSMTHKAAQPLSPLQSWTSSTIPKVVQPLTACLPFGKISVSATFIPCKPNAFSYIAPSAVATRYCL